MGPVVDPVESDVQIPTRTGVVVVGGGIIGVSTAFFLAQKGVPVVLCEKGHIGAEHEAWLEHARTHQLDTRMLTSAEVADLAPGGQLRLKGALYTPSDGRAEPQKPPAIARAAQALGATVLTGCAVRGVETTGGRVAAAITEKGRIACDAIVLAGGAWSRLFCGNLGLALPQLKVRSSVMRTERLDGGPEIGMLGPGFGVRKRLDGGYTVANLGGSVAEIVPDSFRLFFDFLPALRSEWGSMRLSIGKRFLTEWQTPRRWPLDKPSPFEAMRVLDPAPVAATNQAALADLTRAFPVFAQARIAQQWAGMIDVTPDAIPVIGPIDSVPGFFVATGFSGHGFGIGPGAGRLMADLVSGATPVVDPTPFRFSRFTDGTKMQPHSHV